MKAYYLIKENETVTFLIGKDTAEIVYHGGNTETHSISEARSIYRRLLRLNYKAKATSVTPERTNYRDRDDCSERYRNTNTNSASCGGWSNKH